MCVCMYVCIYVCEYVSMLERVLTFDLGDFDQFVHDMGGEFV